MPAKFNTIENEFTEEQQKLKVWLEQKNLRAEAEIINSYFDQKYSKIKADDQKSLEAVLKQLSDISDILYKVNADNKEQSLSKLRWNTFYDETKIVRNNTLALIKMTPWASIAVSLSYIGYSLAPMLFVPGVFGIALACFSAVVLATCLYKFIKESRNLDFSFFQPIKAYNAEHRVITSLLEASNQEQQTNSNHIITRLESPDDSETSDSFENSDSSYSSTNS